MDLVMKYHVLYTEVETGEHIHLELYDHAYIVEDIESIRQKETNVVVIPKLERA